MNKQELKELLKDKPYELAVEAVKARARRLFKESLYLTAKELLGYADVNRYTHGPMIQALESPTTKKLIVMPRGSLKSSLGVVAYSIWTLLKDPNARILIDSEVYTNSKNFLREIKAHLTNEKLTSLFGEFKSDASWSEGEIVIAQRTHPYKEASITCGGIETIKTGAHFGHVIMDDLNSQNNSTTQEGCEKVLTHYRMNQAILDPGGKLVLIGTRYAANDCIGAVIERELNEQPT